MKFREKRQILMKRIDDQNAMVSKGIDQIDCKTHCHHNSRNRKAKRRTPADAFFLKKLFLCKFRLCFFFFKYKAFAEHIVQYQYHHLDQEFTDHIRYTKYTAEDHHAENLDKHGT